MIVLQLKVVGFNRLLAMAEKEPGILASNVEATMRRRCSTAGSGQGGGCDFSLPGQGRAPRYSLVTRAAVWEVWLCRARLVLNRRAMVASFKLGILPLACDGQGK